MSTLSALVLTSSSTLTLDFLKDNFIKNMSQKKQLLIMRIMIVFFIVISVIIAMDPPAFIAQLMGISWGALAGALAMIAGLIVVPIVSLITKVKEPNEVDKIFTCYEESVVVKKANQLSTD